MTGRRADRRKRRRSQPDGPRRHRSREGGLRRGGRAGCGSVAALAAAILVALAGWLLARA